MADAKADEVRRPAPPIVVWEWKDDGGWKAYDKDTAKQIEWQYQTGKSFCELNRGYFATHRNYSVSFKHNTQKNKNSQHTRPIRRKLIRPKPKRAAHWNPKPEVFDVIDGRKMELCMKSITSIDQPLDGAFAIVNAANEDLIRGGGVCGAIFKAADPKVLKDECEKAKTVFIEANLRFPEAGDAVLTQSGALSARPKGPDYIVHAIPPNVSAGQSFSKLKDAYLNSLVCSEGMIDSLIFSSLGTGVFGCDIAQSADVFCKVLSNYFTENKHSSIKKIVMVLFDPFDENEAMKQKYIYSQCAKKQFVLVR